MWLKLHVQGLQFGLGQTRLKFCSFALSILRALVESQGLDDAYDDPVNRDAHLGMNEQRIQKTVAMLKTGHRSRRKGRLWPVWCPLPGGWIERRLCLEGLAFYTTSGLIRVWQRPGYTESWARNRAQS
ncbi:hypothetical protein SDC9_111701 [bioreactor metagenome]|uniref:Uncharacterized protein n=1 Tax=bioreactor metagenome TaxID=1076179 RepID=A0A645BH71_9ZZZZ